MKAGTNIIRKQDIHFQYNGNTDGFLLQREVNDWCNNHLNLSIDHLLNNYERNDDIIYIDTIELDVTIDQTAQWKNVLKEKLVQQLNEIIQARVSSNANDPAIKSSAVSFSETLLYFLEHGNLPWWSSFSAKQEFDTELAAWLQNIQQESVTHVSIKLTNRTMRQRIAYQFTTNNFILFVAKLMAVPPQKIEKIFNDVIAVAAHMAQPGTSKISAENFKESLLEKLAFSKSENILNESIAQWLKKEMPDGKMQIESLQTIKLYSTEFIAVVKNMISEKIAAAILENKKKKQFDEPSIGKLIRPGDGQIKPSPIEEHELLPKKTKGKIAQDADDDEESLVAGMRKVDAIEKDGKITDKIKEETDLIKPSAKMLWEGIYINNAGLVIVASFLPMFFKRLAISEDAVITDINTAVCLTNFLATGNETMAEFELVLPKILCGLSPEFVIDTNIQINEALKKEAGELLTSVIEYWSILKNTSVDSLRETFLQRAGKLTFKNDEWMLQVEQKPFDMLLGHLPWNISMIKLSWMPRLLKTEWVA